MPNINNIAKKQSVQTTSETVYFSSKTKALEYVENNKNCEFKDLGKDMPRAKRWSVVITKTEKKAKGKKTGTKMAICREIMKECWDGYQDGSIKRKEIIERFVKEAKATPKGASTFLYNIKNEFTDAGM